MPLPPLADNNSARYFIHYTANFKQHTMQFRYDDGGVAAPPSLGFLGQLTVILNAAAAFIASDLTYNSAEYVPSGSNISIPTGLPLLLVGGTGTPTASLVPAFIGVTGRTVGGRQARFFMLGASYNPVNTGGTAGNYRVQAAENVNVAGLVAALDASDVVAIDNLTPLWKSYLNLGYNSYWQKKDRS